MITTEEAKRIMTEETPVTFMGMEFLKINALIFRKQGNTYDVTAELLDKNLNSVVIAPVRGVKSLDEDKIEIPHDEEIQAHGELCGLTMAELLELIKKGKADAAQDKLHDLLYKLMNLDSLLVAKTRAIEGDQDYWRNLELNHGEERNYHAEEEIEEKEGAREWKQQTTKKQYQ